MADNIVRASTVICIQRREVEHAFPKNVHGSFALRSAEHKVG